VRQWSSCGRSVLLALAVDSFELGLSLEDGAFEGWDGVAATSRREADLLRTSFAARPAGTDRVIHQLDLALDLPRPARPGRCAARFPEGWLVVLDDRSSRLGQPPDQPADEAVHLALRFPALALVVVEPTRTSVVRGRSVGVEPAMDRGALWETMAGAVATLDLRQPRPLGREILESMLVSTPVVVPATSQLARDQAEASNGGLWYRNSLELAACVGQLLDPTTRGLLGAQARKWASHVHGNQDLFVRATYDTVLRTSVKRR
ncbi:MAG: hypothetical protein ACRDX8_13540, partial [Acidimicrobiales bacterium]